MVNVRMRQDDGVNRGWVEGKMQVARVSFGARPLVKSAVLQQTLAIDFDQMHRTGHRLRGAVECHSHWESFLILCCKRE